MNLLRAISVSKAVLVDYQAKMTGFQCKYADKLSADSPLTV